MIQSTDRMLSWLENALDMSARRHSVLAGNIANVDTPGFSPKDVEFTDYLRKELDHAAGAPPALAPALVARPGAEPGLDGNRVDLDAEMTQMSSNKLFFNLAGEIINRRLSIARYAMDEGGR